MPRVLKEEVMQSAINCKLSSTQHVLAQEVTREEIKHAMFSLKNNKAPVRMASKQVSSKECGI